MGFICFLGPGASSEALKLGGKGGGVSAQILLYGSKQDLRLLSLPTEGLFFLNKQINGEEIFRHIIKRRI